MEDKIVAKISLEIIDGRAVALFESNGRWDVQTMEYALRAGHEAMKVWDTNKPEGK